MSRSKSLSSWKAPSHTRSATSSSIRGKISNPIPMTDDDEFPIRTPGAGIATPLGTEGLEKQLHIPPPISDSPAEVQNDSQNPEPIGTAVTTNSDSDTSPSPAEEYRAPTVTTESHAGYESAYMRDSLASQQTRSRGGSGGGADGPARKKSTLKSVVRRLFGRKRKSDASGSTMNTVEEKRAGQHRSDPIALTRNFDSHALSPKRSVSLPINDFNRALTSHSPFQEHFSQHTEHPEQAPPHEDASAVYRGRHRSATTSRLYSPHKSASYGDWTGLTPRPASQHVRGSKLYSEDEADAIGYAITSGSHPHRRSRSLSHLREAAQEQAERRRSDEIRFWRESYDVDPLSPTGSRPDTAHEPSEHPFDATEHNHDHALQLNEHEKPEPFNFGPIHSEMAGMKITKAVGLEERVSHLENRLLRMEKRISHAPRNSIVLQDPPRNRSRSKSTANGPNVSHDVPSLERPSMETATSQSSRSDPPTFITSATTSPNLGQTGSNRLSTSTVTPSTRKSLPNLGKDQNSAALHSPSHLNIEHYHTLLALITREQSLRQRLESQVLSLQSQVLDLQAVNLQKKGVKGYPTPSPDDRLRGMGVGVGVGMRGSEHSSFDDSDDEFGDEVDEPDSNEIYQTPLEENGGFEGMGSYNGSVMSLARRDRTLSLSQLTYGKGVSV